MIFVVIKFDNNHSIKEERYEQKVCKKAQCSEAVCDFYFQPVG